jgi:hypothetical protein
MTKDPETPESDDEDFPQDDDLTASIRKGLEELQGQQGEDDEFLMDKPLDDGGDAAFDLVRADEAQDMVAEATLRKEKGEAEPDKGEKQEPEGDGEKDGEEDGEEDGDKAEAAPEKKTDSDDAEKDKAEKAEDDGADKADADKDAAPDLAEASIADLIKGMPKRNQGEVTRRLAEAEKLFAPFKGREEEIKHHGTTPAEIMGRFLQINEMALKTPDEYLGWYAQQVGSLGDEAVAKMDAGLKKIAEARGYKLEKADAKATDDDDDPFMSDSERQMRDEMKALREENERLKGGAGLGPASQPQPGGTDLRTQAEQILVDMETEQNPDGTLKRPEFKQLQPLWIAAVQTFAQKEQREPTREDLARLYDDVLRVQRETFGGAPAKSAADAGAGAVSKDTDAADRASKARNASKLVDGSGQSATRQLAPPEDAPLEDVVKANYARIFGGQN